MADDDPAMRNVVTAGRDDGLSADNACYRVMARRTAWPLATLDPKLAAAASQAGVALP